MIGRRTIVAGAVWLAVYLAGASGVTARESHVCSEVCGAGGSCGQECWLTQYDFDNDNPSTTCSDEGYECCGDGVCEPSAEGCNSCTDDCDYVDSCQGACYSDAQCASGQKCNAARECVWAPGQQPSESRTYCGGSCSSKSDCCGADVCLGSPGQKYCAIPSTIYCSSGHSCSSNSECASWAGSLNCTNGAKTLFCNPGSGMCEINDEPACATGSSEVCK